MLVDLRERGLNYYVISHLVVLRALLHLLVVANQALIVTTSHLYVILLFVFLLVLLALLLSYRLFP